jgi:hypothetical protein
VTKTALVALGTATLALASHAGAADPPTCSWSPNPYTSVTEGNAGTTSASLDLVCGNPTSETFTVAYSTHDGWAVSPADYVAASGVVSVPPGDSTARISVDAVGDVRPEATEPLGIRLSEASGQLSLPPTTIVNIVDDDGFSVTSIGRSASEGNSGPTVVDVEVRLSDPLEHHFNVTFYTQDVTATAGSDYEATNQTQTFAPGDVSKTFTVTVLGDTEDEPDETFLLGLGTPGVQTLTGGLLTIVDDDEPTGPCILLSDTAVSMIGTVSTPTTRRFAGPVPRLTVTNCGNSDVNLKARGADATGSSGTWQLTNAFSGGGVDSTCDRGPNIFRADLTLWWSDGGGTGTPLTTADTTVIGQDGSTPFVLASAAAHEFSPSVELPCEGSVGIGEPMTTEITLTAIAPE